MKTVVISMYLEIIIIFKWWNNTSYTPVILDWVTDWLINRLIDWASQPVFAHWKKNWAMYWLYYLSILGVAYSDDCIECSTHNVSVFWNDPNDQFRAFLKETYNAYDRNVIGEICADTFNSSYIKKYSYYCSGVCLVSISDRPNGFQGG